MAATSTSPVLILGLGMNRDVFNKCDECGKFIPYEDFTNGAARKLLTPQSDLSEETWETLCKKHHAYPVLTHAHHQ
jgi:hypothetical protein